MSQDTPPSPAVLRLMNDFARESGADGVTLWKADASHLTAVANPLEQEVIGIRQPLGSGLISQAYLTGQAILEEDLNSHPAHDPTIDLRLGKRCRSMMAAPLETEHAGGVISAVVFESSPHAFALVDLGKLVALARGIETMAKEDGW